ncbi:hypothetical protein D3C77_671620 [compost metagenome]
MMSLSSALMSPSSKIEKPGLYPRWTYSLRMMFRPRLWKVDTVRPLPSPGLSRVATRAFISRAALLVKVTATMYWARIPHCWIR